MQVRVALSDKATLARELRALEDDRASWPYAHVMLVALYAPAVTSLPHGIELHGATTWLLEAELTRI